MVFKLYNTCNIVYFLHFYSSILTSFPFGFCFTNSCIVNNFPFASVIFCCDELENARAAIVTLCASVPEPKTFPTITIVIPYLVL